MQLLEDDTHLAPLAAQLGRSQSSPISARDEYFTRIRQFEARDTAQQGCLAGSAEAEHSVNLTCGYEQAYSVECGHSM